MADIKDRFTPQQAAGYLGIEEGVLRVWRRRNYGPPYLKMGRAVVYLRKDLDAWIAASRVETLPPSRERAGVTWFRP